MDSTANSCLLSTIGTLYAQFYSGPGTHANHVCNNQSAPWTPDLLTLEYSMIQGHYYNKIGRVEK